ncbi:MAG: uracil-DNA glycosylase family protein [archaeon]
MKQAKKAKTTENRASLNLLWKQVEKINRNHFPENRLAPIVGNGKTFRPKFMFVFINPTKRNISSETGWKGPRFPFIGTKHVWRIFNRAGLLDDSLMKQINRDSNWTLEFTDKVLRFLSRKGIYITNIVKWTGSDAGLPDSKKIGLFLPILKKEIGIVQPKYVVAFGLIPFEKLTGRKITLRDYYEAAMKTRKLEQYELKTNLFETKIIPCYFPVSRGEPKKAVEIIRLLKTLP